VNHDHNYEVKSYNRSFAIGVILNIAFVAIEVGYGILADSLALIADAGHNLSDVMSLLLAWGAGILAAKPATENRTYGFRKVTILASLTSALLLLFALGAITWETIGRFQHPKPVEGMTVVVVATIGVFINTLTALLFVKGQKHDLNIRGAFLHMAADAGVSLGVVVAGIIITLTGWLWIDPVISLVIVAIIFIGTWGLLRDSTSYVLDFVPRRIDIQGIQQFLLDIDKVQSIHDLHIWPLSTTETALTVHLVVNEDSLDNAFLVDVAQRLHDHFNIEHSTIQIETLSKKSQCKLKNNC
jgi:cobalt-zinc-cadmium efflux system protein